ncbi:PEP-utilizing enzyme [Candidatus Pelagibacter sp.]|nr:PEP-utilizing enzyme [Candidatus Pelagibacter sp.]
MRTGKANYLEFYNKQTKKKYVPKFIFFTKKDFISSNNKYLDLIKDNFKNKIIIRSSAIDEDTKNFSNAGKYHSFSNIDPKNKSEVSLGIKKILKLFKNMGDQVIIQEFLEKPDISGVVFTYDTNNNAPYYIINYDRSNKTDLITSGTKNDTMETLYVYRNKFEIKSEIFNRLIKTVKKIEKIFLNNKLDIEFSIKKKRIYIFQIRPLTKTSGSDSDGISVSLNNISKKIKKLKTKLPDIEGKDTIFSNMSDWNPAEMIGDKPKPLSISLYSELITNSIWAEQRNNYGYQDVKPNRLMVNLGGSPFIDLRTDLNSFLPKKINSKIKNKIVENCINLIKKKPFLHDKLEFDVIPTCFNFTIDDELKKIIKDKNEALIYKKALKNLTLNILNKNFLPYKSDLNQISKIDSILKKIKSSKLSPIQKIYFLVYYCKIYGTLPFAGIARVAFISTNILISLLKNKKISKDDYNLFYTNLNTIAKKINLDYNKFLNNKISKKKFTNKYGHLRPSSYSISSQNYKEGFNLYFSKIKNNINIKNDKKNNFKLDKLKINNLNKLLKKDLNLSAKEFFKFAKKSIEKREYAKYKFMNFVNEIFNNILVIAKEIKINRNDLEYLDINSFLDSYSNLNNQRLEKILRIKIAENKKNYKLTERIKFPDVIIKHNDCYQFKQTVNNGNYISNKKIVLKVVKYNFKMLSKFYKNKVVLIENADPGYDFLFNFKIGGLITKYGGSNSHMSIRCLELDMPAIIGIGDKNFKKLLKSNTIELICKEKRFRIIN